MATSTPAFMLGFLGDLLTVWAPFLIPLALLALAFVGIRTIYPTATANAHKRVARRVTTGERYVAP